MTLEIGAEKIQGYIMKVSLLGLMIELDKITFPVGTFMNAQFYLNDTPIIEKVRSIKHYDRYFRVPPKKRYKQGEEKPVPKKLCEVQFQKALETTRTAIQKVLMEETQKAKK